MSESGGAEIAKLYRRSISLSSNIFNFDKLIIISTPFNINCS